MASRIGVGVGMALVLSRAFGAEPREIRGGEREYRTISFADLASFKYESVPPGTAARAIPASVRSLDGARVTLEGFMVPLTMQDGKIDRFMLSRVMYGCCFGDTPALNELVEVTLAGGSGSEYFVSARVSGRLEVGEQVDAVGCVQSLYRLMADSVVPASASGVWSAQSHVWVPLLVIGVAGAALAVFVRLGRGSRGGLPPVAGADSYRTLEQ
jgi:hypothetical protein